jgi:hypothetical protein
VCGGSRGSLEKVDAPAASVTAPGVHSGGKRVNDLDRGRGRQPVGQVYSRLGLGGQGTESKDSTRWRPDRSLRSNEASRTSPNGAAPKGGAWITYHQRPVPKLKPMLGPPP